MAAFPAIDVVFISGNTYSCGLSIRRLVLLKEYADILHATQQKHKQGPSPSDHE